MLNYNWDTWQLTFTELRFLRVPDNKMICYGQIKIYSLNNLTFSAVAPLGPFPISYETTLFSFILS
jgi:hypothetical protein